MNTVHVGLVCLALVSCAHDPEGYLVSFQLQGSSAAFHGRTITVGGKQMPPPGNAPEPGQLGTYVGLCTANHSRFLGSPVRIVVREGDSVVDDLLLERVACRDATEDGVEEINHLLLDENGHVNGDFGSSKDVWASCTANSPKVPCPNDEL
jgi:hypothetical protein